jgi:hypothetical protein
MMKARGLRAAIVVILVGLAASAGAAETMKHSGSIFAIGDDATTFVLAEVGPWEVRGGATVITYRTITVTPETRFAIVGRDADTASGFPGEFLEMPLGPDGIYLNDYVTIDCLHDGTRMIALKITVTEVFPSVDTPIGTPR